MDLAPFPPPNISYDLDMAKRPVLEMPADVRLALEKRELFDEYSGRPHYQRNDYLSWIVRAKREETRRKRLGQMLDELELGGIYMGMEHPPSRK
jgi:uncharacterized protein YdeI (YjbR/CyaY-like superfamily)